MLPNGSTIRVSISAALYDETTCMQECRVAADRGWPWISNDPPDQLAGAFLGNDIACRRNVAAILANDDQDVHVLGRGESHASPRRDAASPKQNNGSPLNKYDPAAFRPNGVTPSQLRGVLSTDNRMRRDKSRPASRCNPLIHMAL